MARLVRPRAVNLDGSLAGADENPVKAYFERVALYVPSEIVAAYITVLGLISSTPPRAQGPIAVAIFVLCLILTPVYLSRFAAPNEPRATQLIVSTLAFIIWAYAVGADNGLFGNDILNWYNGAIASILLVVFTLISGAIVPTLRRPQPQAPAG
jgi:hypothetical protein